MLQCMVRCMGRFVAVDEGISLCKCLFSRKRGSNGQTVLGVLRMRGAAAPDIDRQPPSDEVLILKLVLPLV